MPLEFILIGILAACGVGFGTWLGRTGGVRWSCGFGISLGVVTLVILGHRSARLAFLPPISWAVAASVEPFLMAAAIALMLSLLIARLKNRRQRVALAVFMAAMIAYYGILPLLMPLLVRRALLATPTRIDTHGICLQSHAYTCGPASAVTCLRAMGIDAGEGTLAVAARSGPGIGTDGGLLAAAINRLYGDAGVTCRYQFLATLDAVRPPAIATIVSPRYGGHYVAVLDVTPTEVIIGDPMSGRDRWPRAEFLSEWTGATDEFHIPGVPLRAASRP